MAVPWGEEGPLGPSKGGCVTMAVPSELSTPPLLYPFSLPCAVSLHPPQRICVFLKGGQDSNGVWSFWAQFSPRFYLHLSPSSDHINTSPCLLQLDAVLILTTRGHQSHTLPSLSLRVGGSPQMGGQRTKTLGMGTLHRDTD